MCDVQVMARLHINSFKVQAILPLDWSQLALAAAATVAGGEEGTSGSAVYLFASLFNHRQDSDQRESSARTGLSTGAQHNINRCATDGWLDTPCSCCPNLAVSHPYNDATALFTAARDIEAGEQLTITYIDTERPFHGRQQELWWSYGFHCACALCKEEGQPPLAGH